MGKLPPLLVLCGGLGTRLKELALDRPKSLVPVLGKPFLYHQLALFQKQGFSEVVLVAGHLASQISEYLSQVEADGLFPALHVSIFDEGPERLGTGLALLKALESSELAGGPELPGGAPCIAVTYGDSYLDFDVLSAFEAFKHEGKAALMTVTDKLQGHRPNCSVEGPLVLQYSKAPDVHGLSFIDYGLSFYKVDELRQAGAELTGLAQRTVGSCALDLGAIQAYLARRREMAAYLVELPFFEVGSIEGIAALCAYLQN